MQPAVQGSSCHTAPAKQQGAAKCQQVQPQAAWLHGSGGIDEGLMMDKGANRQELEQTKQLQAEDRKCCGVTGGMSSWSRLTRGSSFFRYASDCASRIQR